MFLGAGVASSLAQVTWPMIAPEHLRYSQYQLGLGARCVCVSVQGLGFRVLGFVVVWVLRTVAAWTGCKVCVCLFRVQGSGFRTLRTSWGWVQGVCLIV